MKPAGTSLKNTKIMKLLDKMSKSKKKQVPLPTRPPPPSVDMILKDMEMAPKNDVAFTTFKNEELGEYSGDLESDLMAATYEKQAGLKREDSQDDDRVLRTTVNTVYKKVNQFLQNCEYLKSAPDVLNDQCRHMEKVAVDLEKTVWSLQDAAVSDLGAS